MAPTLASALTLSTLGHVSKAFLNLACKDVRVQGLEHLFRALEEPDASASADRTREVGKSDARRSSAAKRSRRRGIITICNHTSVVDDPLMWGMMPLSTWFPFATPRYTSRHTRWTLGASDIMFKNPIMSKFFSLGQVIETVRGGGIFQPAIDDAIRKLGEGEWVNIFPEGKVNQPNLHPPGGMRRFKWGVSRMIMDAEEMPEVIPIWISGFDDVMPDTRKYLRFLPRPGKSVSITVGSPITSKILPLVEEWRRIAQTRGSPGVGGKWSASARRNSFDEDENALTTIRDAQTRVQVASRNPERQARALGLEGEERVRIEICDLLYKELQGMGIEVEKAEGKDKRPWRTAVSIDGKVHT
ncbi:hypothetical protein NliqN6_3914 [Naganishia liquefaciens]|uniref:Tafazzin family protein n=1 Tax=Naganishia liquefaciens TaxID=104408 RepID=A0A8H3TUQ5_9TREE|nr:hypothetical protein NliqN6_3914 [Naganishia liquefaciens]